MTYKVRYNCREETFRQLSTVRQRKQQMKITVFNGSPKGEQSVTMQYVKFLQKLFPQHTLTILHVAQRIKKIEKDETAFQDILDEVRSSDGVLWGFPVYVALVPANYKRFIELLFERQVHEVFRDKYAAVLSTSIHFYDHTAHNYMHAVCEDLGMRYVDFFSAEMYDLTKAAPQQQFRLFTEHFFEAIAEKQSVVRRYQALQSQSVDYHPGGPIESVQLREKKVVIVADVDDPQSNLGKMVERVHDMFGQQAEVVNLATLKMQDGCVGCMRCAYDNICVWEGKDDYHAMYRNTLMPADIIIFAGNIRDRYLSSRWKMFFDRSFFNNHAPSFMGKQFGFMVSGPLHQISNLREILQAYTEIQHAQLTGIVTDESGDSEELDSQLQQLAQRLVRNARRSYVKPATFLGVGGMKIFRDGIWGAMRFPFAADYAFYRAQGFFDFPQKQYKSRLFNFLMLSLSKIPAMRQRIYAQEMIPGMLRPLKKIVDEAE